LDCFYGCLNRGYESSYCSRQCKCPGYGCPYKKRSSEDEKVSAQNDPPLPWQMNGPGKRSAEEGDCLEDC
ncbi:hypothetical protein PENTCL1PPCAC_21136, partial [Pristionchus entomophagus]